MGIPTGKTFSKVKGQGMVKYTLTPYNTIHAHHGQNLKKKTAGKTI
jgi:hypothetical protein